MICQYGHEKRFKGYLKFHINLPEDPTRDCFIEHDQGRIQDFPLGMGASDVRHGCYLAKMYVKRKEWGPVGGVSGMLQAL